MPCQTVSILQPHNLNPITKNLIVKALQGVCSTEDVNQAKINAGSEIYSKLVDGTKNWTTFIASIDMAEANVNLSTEISFLLADFLSCPFQGDGRIGITESSTSMVE